MLKCFDKGALTEKPLDHIHRLAKELLVCLQHVEHQLDELLVRNESLIGEAAPVLSSSHGFKVAVKWELALTPGLQNLAQEGQHS